MDASPAPKVPPPASEDGSISMRLRGFLATLEHFAKGDDHTWVSTATLLEKTGLSEGQLFQFLKDGEAANASAYGPLWRRVKDKGRKARTGILLLRRTSFGAVATDDRALRAHRAAHDPRWSNDSGNPESNDSGNPEPFRDDSGKPEPDDSGKSESNAPGKPESDSYSSDSTKQTVVVVSADDDDDVSSSTSEGPEESRDGLPENPTALDLVLAIHRGQGSSLRDRAVAAVMQEICDRPDKEKLHRGNLRNVAKGDDVAMMKALAGLLAGKKAVAKGKNGGEAFADAWLDFEPPTDPEMCEIQLEVLIGDIRAIDDAEAERQRREQARVQAQEAAKAEAIRAAQEQEIRRRERIAALFLDADAPAGQLAAAIRDAGLDMRFQRWDGETPKFSIFPSTDLDLIPGPAAEIIKNRRADLAPFLPNYEAKPKVVAAAEPSRRRQKSQAEIDADRKRQQDFVAARKAAAAPPEQPSA